MAEDEEKDPSETVAIGSRRRRTRLVPIVRDPAAGPEGAADPDGLELPTRFQRGEPGEKPGIELSELAAMPRWKTPAPVTCIDYGPDRVESRTITDLDALAASRRPEWARVRWINVDGLDPAVIRTLAIQYSLHPLAIEDLFNTNQRPKFDTFDEKGAHAARLFLIVRMVLQHPEGGLDSEQIGIFVGLDTVLTFPQEAGDVWEPIRKRIANPASKIRTFDASYLLYALIDAVVDHCFPVLERYGDRIEELEDAVLERPDRAVVQEIHQLKRDLLLLRRTVWPMREMINGILREPHECLSETTRTYLRDAYDHAIQIMDIIETYREVAASLVENYMTSMSNRMNEIMKVLTIIGTIFIPLTFLAGIYGMNFKIPEYQWAFSYPMFWVVCLVVASAMLAFFRRRRWI